MGILNFSDYRLILKDFIAKKPQKGRGEIGRLAEHLSIHPTALSQIMNGHKEMNLEQGLLATQYLNLTPAETKYFLLLIEKERAGSAALRKYFSEEIKKEREQLQQVSKRIGEHRPSPIRNGRFFIRVGFTQPFVFIVPSKTAKLSKRFVKDFT